MPAAPLLRMQPEVLEKMNHQRQLREGRLNEFNVVCKQNKAAPYTGFRNEPTVICVFEAQHAFFRWLLSVSFDFIQPVLHAVWLCGCVVDFGGGAVATRGCPVIAIELWDWIPTWSMSLDMCSK